MNTQRIVITTAIASMLVACANLKVELPDPPGEQKNQWATQGWTNADRHWYHHAEQGTNTFGLPVEWFKALEQPDLSAAKPGLFSDQEYLARFGFIKSPRSVVREELSTNELARYGYTAPAQKSTYSGYSANAENLPVGFGVGGDWLDSERKPLPIPGTIRNARSGEAPRLRATRSWSMSKVRKAEPTTSMTTGIANMLCASTRPASVLTSLSCT